jgi:DNA invertase Pin-like site-specific DNA recombinase
VAAGIVANCKTLLNHLREEDVVVVWKPDRLSRSLKDVLTLMETLRQKKDVSKA